MSVSPTDMKIEKNDDGDIFEKGIETGTRDHARAASEARAKS